MKTCNNCNQAIPEARLRALPNTKVCVNCSSVAKVSGFMSWEHKTAPALNICTAEQAEQVHAWTRRVGQGVIPGIRMKGH